MVVSGGLGRNRWLILAFVGLALSVAVLRPAEFLWWFARLAGVGAILAMTLASLVTPRSVDRTGRTYQYHQWTGRIGVGLALLHPAVIAAGEPDIWRYAGTLATSELVAGTSALVLLVALTLVRDPLSPWMRSSPAATAFHRWAAVAAIILSFRHVATNPAMPKIAFVLLAVAAAVLVRPHAEALVGLARRAPRGILAAVVAACLVMAVAGWGVANLSQRALRETPIDHAGFDHKDHTSFTCVSCHHNFSDGSGTENCFTCHKRLSVSSTTRVDRMFHRFCSDCHEHEWWRTLKAAPFKSCSGCHGARLP